MFEADRWGGNPNDGEFHITGTSFTTHGRETIILKYYAFSGKRVTVRRRTTGPSTLYYLHWAPRPCSPTPAGARCRTPRSTTSPTAPPGPGIRPPCPLCSVLWTEYNFTGQRLDMSTGLLYYGARYYDPALGRFISADTVVPEPGNPQALNRFSYVLNNPLKYTDPTGHKADPDGADVEKQPNADPPPPPPMGTWEYIRWLLTLISEGREVLNYINSHGTKIHVIGNLQDAGNALYPNNMIVLNATRFHAQDQEIQIDVAGVIGHEVEHLIWGDRGALWPSREQEGAAFAQGDAIKAALFRYFGKEEKAAEYDFPDMTTEQRIAALQDNPEYGSGWYTDHQIWGIDLVRDIGSTISRWYYDWWYNQNCSGNVEGVYP